MECHTNTECYRKGAIYTIPSVNLVRWSFKFQRKLLHMPTRHRTCILKTNPWAPYNFKPLVGCTSVNFPRKEVLNTLEGDYTPFITVKEMVKNVCLGFLSITSNSFSIMIDDWNCWSSLTIQQLHWFAKLFRISSWDSLHMWLFCILELE